MIEGLPCRPYISRHRFVADTMKQPSVLTLVLCVFAACNPAPEPDEIAIGVVLPMSGPMAIEAGHVGDAIAMALDEINASGQLGGTQLTTIAMDDTLTPSGSIAAFQSLIDLHDVKFVVGPASSSSTEAIIPLIDEAGIIAFSPTSSMAGLSARSPNLFRATLTAEKSIPLGIQIARERLGFGTVATIYNAADRYSTDSHRLVTDALSAYPDVAVVSQQQYQGDPTDEAEEYDLSAQMSAIESAAPDLIISAGLPEDQHAVLASAHAAGITDVPFFLTMVSIDEVARINADVPGAAEGLITTTPWLYTSQYPRSLSFVADFEERFGESPGDFAALSHATMHILANALSRAADHSPASVREALANTRDLETALGSFSFDEHGDALYAPIVVQVQRNAFVELQASDPE